MNTSADVLVLGVGGMGSAACAHLADRGASVIGIDAHPPGHALGSSHGDVRLIRQAYFEAEAYVPLLKRAYELWDELQEQAKASLFHRTGLLLLAPESHAKALGSARASAEKHRIPVEVLGHKELAQRYPRFRLADDYVGLWEPSGGYLEVERCVVEHARLAVSRGASLAIGETVQSFAYDRSGVTVTTDKATYRGGKLVITAGPWSGTVLRELKMPLTARRVVQFWFEAGPGHEERDGFPCFAFDTPDGFFYGFPRRERGLKVAEHHFSGDIVTDPAKVDRQLRPEDSARVSVAIERWLPGVRPAPREGSVCMYTMTPDEHFIVDKHPANDRVVFATGFSGHGFKFASSIGEILADLSLDGFTRHPIDFLALRRLLGR